MTDAPLLVTKEDVIHAYARIRDRVRRTPVLDLPRGAFGHDGFISLKLEMMQHAGSFKPRGAFNTVLGADVPKVGIAAASGGNHGAATAYVARELALPARIFVPEISSAAKVAAIRGFGAEVVIGGARYQDAQDRCDAYVKETGALRVHPFDGEKTIAGQGTVGLEWVEQASAPLDTVLVGCGGGGLVAGLGAWFFGSKTKVVAVEPEGSRALHAALEAKKPIDVPVESVAADSLGARNVGPRVYAVCARAIDHVALVRDDAITDAQRQLWKDFRIAVEPGGAAAVAALASKAYAPKSGERVGVLVCGANVDLGKLAAITGA